MADLWFDRELGDLSCRGAMIYASRPGEVWAVLPGEAVHVDLAQESAELLGLYGASAHSIGHLFFGAGVALPPALKTWAVAPDVTG